MSDKEEQKGTIPFFPDHLATESKVAAGILMVAIVVAVLGTLNPIGLGAPADPMETPAHTKPEWYFLFLYQLLKYVPKAVGSTLPFVLVALLALWPFLDRRSDSHQARRFRFILVVAGLAAVLMLTLLGEFS